MALNLSSVATSILNNLGSNGYVKLVQLAETYDPVTGTKSQTETVVNLAAVDLPVPTDLVDGEYIKTTDKLIVMDGAVEPTTADLIRISGKDYRIVQVEQVNHAGTPQIYKVIAGG